MNRAVKQIVLMLAGVLGAAVPASADIIVDKAPDLGAYWFSLSGGGSYVYADSFVFTGSTGTLMQSVGIYMLKISGGPGSLFRFEVYGDNGGAPDPTNVLGITGYLRDPSDALSLVTNNLISPVSLSNGERYWIAGSTVGQPNEGEYQVGGHSQNSIYNDNGTFWYSNDSAGQSFDGAELTPEMAIYASTDRTNTNLVTTPEPASLTLLAIGLVSGWAVKRRRRLA